jgi:cephalosporin-C deacetylase-like acetyl esterase
MKTTAFVALFLLCGAGMRALADAPVNTLADGRAGRISFKAANRMSTVWTLVAGTYAMSDTIWGDLFMPEVVSGVVSAMVISHGSSGPNVNERAWAEMFAGMGVATFVIDHFSGRGIAGTGSDQSQISGPVPAADGLMALRLLATHPRIDPGRIGYIGFSKGGAAQERRHRPH